jgi:hypothetical protein
MKMSAARIRSLFNRYDSVHNEVFRFVPAVAPALRVPRFSPVCASATQSRQAILDQTYRENMRRELKRAGLL